MIHPLAFLTVVLLAQDSATLALRRRVWDGLDSLSGLSALERVERHTTPGTASRQLADVRSALDTMVFGTSWGGAELDQLRLAFPGSALLARYAVLRDERMGLTDAALAGLERLIWLAPADAELQRLRGRLLERTNHPLQALDAYTRAFDLAPEDDSTFVALRILSERQGTLERLLEQVRRLRIRLPASRILADHETEVSQRLGVTR